MTWPSRTPESIAQYRRTYRQRHPEKRYEAHLRDAYGLTVEQYVALLAETDGCCAVCGRTDHLCVDHDHETGEIRGILCRRCNSALGLLGDDFHRICHLAAYLAEPRG